MRLRSFVVTTVALVAVLSVACGTGSSPDAASPEAVTTSQPAASSAACTATALDALPPRSTQVDVSLSSSGVDRTYEQYVPASYDASPTPLVVDLHGYLSGAAGQAMMSDLGGFSEGAGFVVATPQGNGPLPYWNAVPHDDLPDDVQFVSDLIDDVSRRLCIDPDRVYVTGLSNGAFLTSLVACRLADRVAAVAAVAGLQLPADCAPSRPVPVLAIHGTDDRFVPFEGGPGIALDALQWNAESTRAFSGLPFAPVTEAAGAWAAIDGCSDQPRDEAVSPSVRLVRYVDCRDGSAVELFVVDGGGHTWPGSAFSTASASALGATTDEIDANEEIWRFFEAHPMSR